MNVCGLLCGIIPWAATSGMTRDGLANAMSELNGGMEVASEEISTMMQDATVSRCVSSYVSS